MREFEWLFSLPNNNSFVRHWAWHLLSGREGMDRARLRLPSCKGKEEVLNLTLVSVGGIMRLAGSSASKHCR